jgi:hypothetical protein
MGRRAGPRRQDQREAAAARADIGLRFILTRRGATVVVGIDIAFALPTRDGLSQQLSAKRESRCAMAIGEEPEVADAMEAGGQDVQEEPAHELARIERHDLAAAFLPIVLPEEADGGVGRGDEPAVGDGTVRLRAFRTTRWV